MAYLNENYLKLQAGYLFPEIARRVRDFCEANPEAARRLIRCGIGDVTEPLPRVVIDAMKRAEFDRSVHDVLNLSVGIEDWMADIDGVLAGDFSDLKFAYGKSPCFQSARQLAIRVGRRV